MNAPSKHNECTMKAQNTDQHTGNPLKPLEICWTHRTSQKPPQLYMTHKNAETYASHTETKVSYIIRKPVLTPVWFHCSLTLWCWLAFVLSPCSPYVIPCSPGSGSVLCRFRSSSLGFLFFHNGTWSAQQQAPHQQKQLVDELKSWFTKHLLKHISCNKQAVVVPQQCYLNPLHLKIWKPSNWTDRLDRTTPQNTHTHTECKLFIHHALATPSSLSTTNLVQNKM